MITDFNSWRQELLFVGRIIQDGDTTVSSDERHRRFMRFVEMVDALTGAEGSAAIEALFDSIQVQDSYGAYCSIDHALSRFPESDYLFGLVMALPRLIRELPDQAGEHLVSIANGIGGKWGHQVDLLNAIISKTAPDIRDVIISFIRSQETSGWLTNRVGVLCPLNTNSH
jgi:hypothetical protein